jgi:hypothetical protein
MTSVPQACLIERQQYSGNDAIVTVMPPFVES